MAYSTNYNIAPFSNNFSKPKMSTHAEKRVNQRGVSGHLLALVLAHADIETPIGNGCIGLRVSRTLANRCDMRLAFGSDIDKITNIIVVWSELTSSVVTVLHPHSKAASAHYLRLN